MGYDQCACAKSSEGLKNLEQVCHLSYADVPCSEYISQRILDLIVHGWDIARSIHYDDTLDSSLVTFAYTTFLPREKELRDSGLFGKNIIVSSSVDMQTKLLAMLGRKR